MNNMKSVLLGLVMAVSASNASALTVNLVNNGGFEADVVVGAGGFDNYTAVNQGLSGWTIGLNNVDLVSSTLWAPAAGTNSLDLNGLKKGELHQTLNTVVGQLYQLSFDLAGNFYNLDTPVKAMSVNVGGNSTYTFDATGKSASNMGWTNYVTNFYAVNPLTTLSFVSNITGNAGAALDNVSVTAVPEPETYGMMLVGLGLVGLVARRRKSNQA